MALARWVFPTPLRPMKTTLVFSRMKSLFSLMTTKPRAIFGPRYSPAIPDLIQPTAQIWQLPAIAKFDIPRFLEIASR
jgi:hypothetical protein